jgi:hypothetical protein
MLAWIAETQSKATLLPEELTGGDRQVEVLGQVHG